MATPSATSKSAQDKREAVRAAFERRTAQARSQMNTFIQNAEAVREQAIKQADINFRESIKQAEDAFGDEMEAAIRERTVLMNKLLLEA